MRYGKVQSIVSYLGMIYGKVRPSDDAYWTSMVHNRCESTENERDTPCEGLVSLKVAKTRSFGVICERFQLLISSTFAYLIPGYGLKAHT